MSLIEEGDDPWTNSTRTTLFGRRGTLIAWYDWSLMLFVLDGDGGGYEVTMADLFEGLDDR